MRWCQMETTHTQASIIEETRFQGKEHGLSVVCNQLGIVGIRLFKRGKRLAHISITADGKIADSPAPIDGGGMKQLKSHLHLIADYFENDYEEEEDDPY